MAVKKETGDFGQSKYTGNKITKRIVISKPKPGKQKSKRSSGGSSNNSSNTGGSSNNSSNTEGSVNKLAKQYGGYGNIPQKELDKVNQQYGTNYDSGVKLSKGTIKGKVYEGVTDKEIRQNKLNPNNPYARELKNETARRQEKVNINKKTARGETLTPQEQFRAVTGRSASNIGQLNKAIQEGGRNPRQTTKNIRNIQDYNTKAKEYQKEKNQNKSKYTPSTKSQNITKQYSENIGARNTEKWAERLVRKEKEIQKQSEQTRFALGMEGLNIQKQDSWIVKTGKALGNVGYGLTIGAVTGETGRSLLLTGEKAAFNFYALGVGVGQKSVRAANVESAKEQAKGGLNAVTPIDTTTLIEKGKIKYDAQGTANLLVASAGASLVTKVKLNAARKNPTPRTTGKITSKNVKVKGKVETKAATKGNARSDIPAKSRVQVEYSEGKAGLFNKLRGKSIKTKVVKNTKGDLTRIQKDGKITYKTTLKKGSKTATVQKIKGGKVIKKSQVKNPFSKSDLTQYEALLKSESKSATQLSDRAVYQSARKTSVSNVKGRVSKSQRIEGKIKVDTKAESVSRANPSSKVRASTKGGKLQLKKAEIIDTKLQVSKNIQVRNSVETANAPAKVSLQFDSKGNLVKSQAQSGDVTAKFDSTVNTVYGYQTKFQGNLAVKSNKGFLGSQRGSAGLDPAVIEKRIVPVAEIETPSSVLNLQVPKVTANNPGANTPFVPILDTRAEQTIKPSYSSNNKNAIKPSRPTITSQKNNLSKDNAFDLNNTNNSEREKIQSPIINQKKSTGSRRVQTQEKVQIKKPKLQNTAAVDKYNQAFDGLKGIQRSSSNIQRPPISINAPLIFPDFDKQRKSKGYNVISKKGGKPVLLNQEALTYEEAKNFGMFTVDKTARASFKVVEADAPATGSFTGKGKKQAFRRGKKGFFVEKNKFRIDTPGEKKEITEKGIFATKKSKKSKKKKSKSMFGRIF